METVVNNKKVEINNYKDPPKFKHTCYICQNEGYEYVGQGLYRCYREVCIYRDTKGLVLGKLTKRVCYVCGRVGEIHDHIGNYRGLDLFRCSNNNFCNLKLIRGIKILYTDKGVYKYNKNSPKEEQPILLNDGEMRELKKQELKERLAQLQDPKYKPTLIEFCTISLQEKFYTHEELANKFKANLVTVKGVVPTQIKKQGYSVISRYRENTQIMEYKIEDLSVKTTVSPTVSGEELKPKMAEDIGGCNNNKATPIATMPDGQHTLVDKTEQVAKPSQILKAKVGVEVKDSPELSTKVVKPWVMNIPKSGAVFTMFELLKTGEYTMEELAIKVNCSINTVKMQINGHLRQKDINIIKNGDKYSIKS